MWFKIRIALLIPCFAYSAIAIPIGGEPPNVVDESLGLSVTLSLVMSVVFLVFSPLALLAIIGLQQINPLSARIWRKPNWHSNFLNFADPLHFFHFGAFVIIAGGLGEAVGSIFIGLEAVLMSLLDTLVGVGVLLGVKLCIWTYKGKFCENDVRGDPPEECEGN